MGLHRTNIVNHSIIVARDSSARARDTEAAPREERLPDYAAHPPAVLKT